MQRFYRYKNIHSEYVDTKSGGHFHVKNRLTGQSMNVNPDLLIGRNPGHRQAVKYAIDEWS